MHFLCSNLSKEFLKRIQKITSGVTVWLPMKNTTGQTDTDSRTGNEVD